MYDKEHACPKCQRTDLFAYCDICGMCCPAQGGCCTLGQSPYARTPEALEKHKQETENSKG